MDESNHTGTEAYAMTYPDDGVPLLGKEHPGREIAKNASHIQSHPNLTNTNQSTDTMAIAQSNLVLRG